SGIVASLARPGGNITGFATLTPELAAKRLELLKETVPNPSRIGVLSNAGPAQGNLKTGVELQLIEIRTAARRLELKLQEIELGVEPTAFEAVFQSAVRQQISAIVTLTGSFFFAERKRVAELAAKYRLPAIYPQKEYAEAGGLMSYGDDRRDRFRRAAIYVDKILKGTKPGHLPVEQSTKFEFVINLQTARALDLTIPPAVLMEADKVIK